MKKRAQITMESLLLYGAAILVVLLAIAALTYFGVLDLGRYLPEKCNFEGTGVFQCEEYRAQAGGTDSLQLILANKGTKSVDINDATFEATDAGMMAGCSLSGGAVTILPGDTGQLDFDCTTNRADIGDRIGGPVTIMHQFTGGTLETTSLGDLMITVS